MPAAHEPDRRERLLTLLKTQGPATASDLAQQLGITRMGARQHLARLEEDGAVTAHAEVRGVGRPTHVWRLTRVGHGRFPDAHAELAVSLITTLRESLGPDALSTFLAHRTERTIAAYRERLPDESAPLSRRVAALARLRTEEGYMARAKTEKDGAVLLIENHCPICAAAESCQGLCVSELDVFRGSLGDGVEIERIEHVIDGAQRCVYRIVARTTA